jgi:glycosyltransferase involved in cell wall biosynthesis
MNVQHITRRFVGDSWGGTESAVLSLARNLHSLGHTSSILTSMALAQSPQESMGGVDIHRFSHFYPYLGLTPGARQQLDMRAGNLFSATLLRHLLTAPPPDTYHLHTGKRMGGIVRTAARYHRRPYVISLHGGVMDVPAEERQRWTEPTLGTWEWGRLLGAAVGARRVLQDAAAIFCVNCAEQQALQEQMPHKRILWTPNTVDLARYQGGCGSRFRSQHRIPAEAKLVLNVARIDEQKNQLGTVEVFERVASQVQNLWLVLAGPSTNAEYAGRLRRRIAVSRFADRILSLGNVESSSETLIDMYKAADVFLLNSLHEPFGIVLLEAWAAGAPVVAPRVGGISSFVEHDRTGLLFESGDLEDAAGHMQAVLSQTAIADRLSANASARVKEFDEVSATRRMVTVYGEVQREYSLRA